MSQSDLSYLENCRDHAANLIFQNCDNSCDFMGVSCDAYIALNHSYE